MLQSMGCKELDVTELQELQETWVDPWIGKYLGEGHGNPFQYSCQENPTDRGAWLSTVHRVAQPDTTEVT